MNLDYNDNNQNKKWNFLQDFGVRLPKSHYLIKEHDQNIETKNL